MQVENMPGAGARVTLRLPVGEGQETVEAAEPGAPSGHRARILVVEDEAPLREIFTEILTGLGHAVDEAATGQAGMERLERNSYDLIALDLRLPDTDGQTIWRWLRSHNPALAARVTFMTGDTMSAETQTFLQEAGRPVLSKPISIDQIARMVD